MSGKSKANKINKSKNSKKKYESDSEEEFHNSEDEYVTASEDSDDYSQSGGESDNESDNELGDDSATLDIDPDDEQDIDSDGDDKYDPINETDEPVDSDEDIGDNDDNDNDDNKDNDKDNGDGDDDDDNDDIDNTVNNEKYSTKSKQCYLKNLNNDKLVLDEDDSNMYGQMEYKKIADKDRESDNILTYYEFVRCLGLRTQQFNFGAEPLVSGVEGMHPAKMAYVEIMAKMTPLIIRRRLPGKKYEDWRMDELEIIHTIHDNFFVPDNFDWDALLTEVNKINNKTKENIKILDANDRQSNRRNSRSGAVNNIRESNNNIRESKVMTKKPSIKANNSKGPKKTPTTRSSSTAKSAKSTKTKSKSNITTKTKTTAKNSKKPATKKK